jgi:hypothetical protein
MSAVLAAADLSACVPLTPEEQNKRDAWVALLSRYNWDWFGTYTFAGDSVHPERADKLFRVWCSKLNRHIYGPRWHKKPHGGVYWIRALEWQKRGVLHYHALLGMFGGDLNAAASRIGFSDLWLQLAGWGRVEVARNSDAVNRYVTKYVVKGGQLDPSRNLESIVPAQQGLLVR